MTTRSPDLRSPALRSPALRSPALRSPALYSRPLRSLVFLAALLLLGWPLVGIAGARGLFALFAYVFAIWAVLILALFVLGRSPSRNGDGP